MAVIELLQGGKSLLPEGIVTLQVKDVFYDKKKGWLDIDFVSEDGHKHYERFFLKTQDNEVNEGATRAFSFLAKTILQDMDMEEVDTDDLVGGFLTVEVTHVESTTQKDNGEYFMNARISNFTMSDGFDEVKAPKKTKKADPVEDDVDEDDDLDLDFLND